MDTDKPPAPGSREEGHPMNKDELLRLAERVEALDGPDREVDTMIHFLTTAKWIGRIPTWPPTKIERPAMERGLSMHIEGDGYFYGDEVPTYTASIDAAMTLVPKDKHFGLGDRDDTKRAWAWVGGMTGMLATDEELGSGATPALALTAACLRALAQQEREHEKG